MKLTGYQKKRYLKIIYGLPFMKANLKNILSLKDDGKTNERLDLVLNIFSDAALARVMRNFLSVVRFMDPVKTDGIAWTNTKNEIFLSYDKIYSSLEEWKFIFCHECLHQMWDTFKVADEIAKKSKTPVNHYILNIASDCVINEVLARRLGIKPEGIYYGKDIKEKYGVVFDYKRDDQASLYLKLVNSPKAQQAEEDGKNDPFGDGESQPDSQGDGSSQDEQSSGGGQDSEDENNNSQGSQSESSEGKNNSKGGNKSDSGANNSSQGGQQSSDGEQNSGDIDNGGKEKSQSGGESGGKSSSGGSSKSDENFSEDYIRGYNETIEKIRNGQIKI